ncbi:MAG: putative DNA repair protein MutK [Flavobacteriaceae bacterium]|jgi:predicted DNA repair protein MutK
MASGFFALLDDIATLMDDVAALSKATTEKTVGILADDLAVNAEKASGFVSSRELPVLWIITKGSFLNKAIILPVAFLLSAFIPAAIIPILVIGGVYLAYEGAEKIYHYIRHRKDKTEKGELIKMTPEEVIAFEKKKIKSAILVDFILSIEIIILSLGVVLEESLGMQIAVVTIVAVMATIGVYGIVALIVRMDDLGYKLIQNSKSKTSFQAYLGKGLVFTLPWVVRILTVVGTLAMILVAGGIFVHNIHFIHDLVHGIPSMLGEFLVGLVVGIVVLPIILFGKKLFVKRQ